MTKGAGIVRSPCTVPLRFQSRRRLQPGGNLVTSPRPASLISRTYKENCDSTEATRSGSDRQRPGRRRTHAADRARNVGPLDQEAEGAAHSSRGRPPAGRTRAEGEEVITWRLAVPAVLGAATVAACVTYFIAPPPPPPPRVESEQRAWPPMPDETGHTDSAISTNIQHPSMEEDVTAYQRAAEAILKRAQNTRASADEPQPLVTGRIPLPKRRPIPRP